MKSSERFHDLLFEISNENRYQVLLILKNQAKRITDLTREMNLTTTEVRRHVSRLSDIDLIQRDLEGFYHLTPYGETCLILFEQFLFLSPHSEYFKTHSLSKLPTNFVKQIGELNSATYVNDAMSLLRYTDNLFKEAEEYVWIIVDQFPINFLTSIINAIERGVQFRIIETRERMLNPDIESMTSEETRTLARARHTPLVSQRMVDDVHFLLYLSDNQCIVSFPTIEGHYDYKGFSARDISSLKWSSELFLHYWSEATERSIAPILKIQRRRFSEKIILSEPVIINGTDRPEIDAQAVQDAVDNYPEVILRGIFNFGSSIVKISRSVVIRGEGLENDTPSTTIYKKGWRFPFTEFDSIFMIDGEGAEVTIENIRFVDFNHLCIWGAQCNRLTIRNNRITLRTGYGRGMTYGAFGDVVIGIWIRGFEPDVFTGKVLIEKNYIDFAQGGAFGGFLSRGGIEDDPEYRPNLFNHEYYMGFGIAVHHASDEITIENNTIRNTNARGIAVTGCLSTADVQIKRNLIESDVYGSYPFSSPEAGAAILAQSAWGFQSPGFNVIIEENICKLEKLNYSGIKVLGPVMDREGVDKLRGGVISKNHIFLNEGYEGIHVRKCDGFEVVENEISGRLYYGIRISGRRKTGELDLSSLENMVKDNDMSGVIIRDPDNYCVNHADGRMFMESTEGPCTGHIWMGQYTKNNVVKAKTGETVIDEGKDNRIFLIDEGS